MKLARVISQTHPELVSNGFRLASFSRKEGDEVKVFLLAERVALGGINNPKFDVRGQAESFPQAVGRSSHAVHASSCATRKGVLTFTSGLVVAFRMTETLVKKGGYA